MPTCRLQSSLTPLLLARNACRSTLEGNTSPYLSSLVVPTSSLIASFSCFVFAFSNKTGIVSLAVCIGVVVIIISHRISPSPGHRLEASPQLRAGVRDPRREVDLKVSVLTTRRFGPHLRSCQAWSLRCCFELLSSTHQTALGCEVRLFGPSRPLPESSCSKRYTVAFHVRRDASADLRLRKTKYSSWCIATTSNAFSMAATRNPYIQTSGVYAWCHVIISVLSLGQTICMLPRNAKKARALWMFAVVPIWPLLANVYDIHTSTALLPQP